MNKQHQLRVFFWFYIELSEKDSWSYLSEIPRRLKAEVFCFSFVFWVSFFLHWTEFIVRTSFKLVLTTQWRFRDQRQEWGPDESQAGIGRAQARLERRRGGGPERKRGQESVATAPQVATRGSTADLVQTKLNAASAEREGDVQGHLHSSLSHLEEGVWFV